ncbi:hypothetical protein [Rhodovarius sp.]|uniref:hypothetical protein n=1 Tax=Rhodovarius sp. TaxID=2972673 RepID=UPI0034A35F05
MVAPSCAAAEFYRLGPVLAHWSTPFVMGRMEPVDRMQMPGGRIREIGTAFSKVTDYEVVNERGQCSLVIRDYEFPRLPGYAGSAVRSPQGQPRFYRGDRFISDNVESLTFPCIVRE